MNTLVPPFQPEQIINFLYAIYYFLRDLMIFLLEKTIFRDYPGYAATYGDAITFLVSITTVYLILERIASSKKVVKIILALGWSLLFIAIAVSLIR